MNIRKARPADAVAIAGVHTTTWQQAYAHVFPRDALASLDVESRTELWRRTLEQPPPRPAIFLAERHGEVVGFASAGSARRDDERGLGELFAIYVLPLAWGSGAADGLMTAVLAALAERGFAEAILWVLEDNPRARRFYERWGWRLDGGRQRDTFLGVEVDEVRYRIDVSTAT